MPRTNPIKSIQLPGFVGGLNTDADPYQLEADESPDCLNVDFGFRGSVRKRKGYSSLTTTQTDQGVRIVDWKRQGGSHHLISVDDQGDIWDYTSTPAEAVSAWGSPSDDDDYPVGVTALGNVLYFTRVDVTNPQKFDGTSWTAMTATTFDGTASRFPKAKHLATAHSRVFAANVDDGGTRHRSRLHWSGVLDAEQWDAVDFIDFDPDDGQEITALSTFGEELVIFKNHSVQLLAGKSEESFSRFVVDSQLGTVSPRTVVPMDSNLVFFDRDTGVWGFDGAGFELLSEKINEYLLEGINYSLAYKASAFVFRTKLYLSVPWGADTVNSRMFVWDQRTKAWTQYDFGVADATVLGDDVYGVGAGDAAGVQQLLTGLNDDGAAVDAYVYTGWLAPEGPEAKSRIRRLDFAFSALGDYDVDVHMYRDFANNEAYRTQVINTNPGGAVWDTAVWDVDEWGSGADQKLVLSTGWGQRFRTAQFRIGVDGVGDDFQLNRMTIHVSSLGRVRGEA